MPNMCLNCVYDINRHYVWAGDETGHFRNHEHRLAERLEECDQFAYVDLTAIREALDAQI